MVAKCPEMVDTFLRVIEAATPEQLQRFCAAQMRKGGKFAILARFVQREFGEERFEELMRPYTEKKNNA